MNNRLNDPHNGHGKEQEEVLYTMEVGKDFLDAAIEDAGGKPNKLIRAYIISQIKGRTFGFLTGIVEEAVKAQEGEE